MLLLLLTPPLLNVNRLKRRVASSISASLGRPVQLDGVTMHLLPVPGFTLQNLVVSEDPAFGSEPIIRANVVDVTLRPSSLWRRHVEFSSMTFEAPSLNLVRNAGGEWNVQSLLMHAASVTTAPTAQTEGWAGAAVSVYRGNRGAGECEAGAGEDAVLVDGCGLCAVADVSEGVEGEGEGNAEHGRTRIFRIPGW